MSTTKENPAEPRKRRLAPWWAFAVIAFLVLIAAWGTLIFVALSNKPALVE